jgi:chemotaxis protein MotA
MDPESVVELLVKMAIKARREGFLSLRDEVPKENIPLLGIGIGLLADGTDPEISREILETSAASEAAQISLYEMLWRDLSVYGPMFGMLGTLIGLVLMLRSLSDPAAIGPAMALALITTFYGVIIAGIICLPIAGKLRNYNERMGALRVLIIEGLLSIQAGDNSHIVEEKLKARLIKR